MGTSSPKESLLLSVSGSLFHLGSKGICQDSPVKHFKSWLGFQKGQLSTEDPPMRTNEHLSRQDATSGWSCLTGAMCKSSCHSRGGQGRWGHQIHQWASGQLMAPWCHAPKAVSAFTHLLLALLLPPGGISSPKSSAHTVPEEGLVHTAFCSLSVLAATSNTVTGVHRLNIVRKHCIVLLWLWDWGRSCFPAGSAELALGTALGSARGQLYPDWHPTPKSLSPTTETENHWHILFFRTKAWEQSIVFLSRKWKNLSAVSVYITQQDQEMHWFHLAAARVNWWRAKVALPLTFYKADMQKYWACIEKAYIISQATVGQAMLNILKEL